MIMHPRKVRTLLAALLVAGCGIGHPSVTPSALKNQIAQSPALLESYYAGTTIVVADPNEFVPDSAKHGVQVEYHSANGQTYLWYAGNAKPVRGQWQIQSSKTGKSLLCYKYGANAYNPVTRRAGGNWECEDVRLALTYQAHALAGDPFGLASGNLPFVIPDKRYRDPETLMQMAGRDPSALNYITEIGEVGR